MKTQSVTVVLALLSCGSLAPAIDVIRQVREVDGVYVTTDFPLFFDSGSVVSAPLDSDISVFQLFTSYANSEGTVEFLKLDEKVVGSYLPSVDVTVSSEDPFVPTTTRADRPYSVTVKVDGLLDGPDIPNYLKSIDVKRGYVVHAPLANGPSEVEGEYPGTYVFTSNGTYSEAQIYQQLPDGCPTQAIGSESFKAYLLPEADPTQAMLAEAEVKILPVSTAGIHGIVEGGRYSHLPDDISVDLVNAYPRSTTYARIYKGAPRPEAGGNALKGTILTFGGGASDPNLPQHGRFHISPRAIMAHYTDDGHYTVEIVTLTPFNGGAPELLSSVSFEIHSVIKVNGSVTSVD